MPQELDQAKIVAAIQSSAQEVFSTMLSMDLAAQEPHREMANGAPTTAWSP
jgi:hypothetical protein